MPAQQLQAAGISQGIVQFLKPTYIELAELPTGLKAPFHHGRGSTLGPHHPLFTYDPQVSDTLTCVGKDPIHLC